LPQPGEQRHATTVGPKGVPLATAALHLAHPGTQHVTDLVDQVEPFAGQGRLIEVAQQKLLKLVAKVAEKVEPQEARGPL